MKTPAVVNNFAAWRRATAQASQLMDDRRRAIKATEREISRLRAQLWWLTEEAEPRELLEWMQRHGWKWK